MAGTRTNEIAAGRRDFRMHPRLLWDVITKQAGTIEKSVLEAVMNSVDAGSSRVDISLDDRRFVISDDGRGFEGAEQVEKFFETFGQPHEEGDATYGRYRMGRGQLFCFGVNTWLSNEFRMVVDMRPQESVFKSGDGAGLGYDLSIEDVHRKGCQVSVDLYDKLLPSQLARVVREVEQYVKYAQVPVFLNGRQINEIPKDVAWKVETEDGYFDLKESGTLKVYNLGVLVRDFYASSWGGIGGVVVSKKRLDVNFARNDIVASCKVWKAIQATLRAQAGYERKRKVKLTDVDRETLAQEIVAGDLTWDEILDAKVVTDVAGDHHPVLKLARLSYYSNKVLAVQRGDRKGDKALQARLAFPLDAATLTRFGVDSTRALFDVLVGALRASNAKTRPASNPERQPQEVTQLAFALGNAKHIDARDLENFYSGTHETVPAGKLTKYERVCLKALQACCDEVHGAYIYRNGYTNAPTRESYVPYGRRPRTVLIGESDVAQGWTDGTQHIWFNRTMLPLLKKGRVGWAKLTGLAVHEYNHGSPDTGTHVHDADFYRAVHDQILDTGVLGKGVDAIERELFAAAKAERKVNGTMFKEADRASVLRDAGLDVQDPLAEEHVPDEASIAARAP